MRDTPLNDQPLELLFERSGLPSFASLPAALVAQYGGPLGFSRPRVFANFVASLDGVVALAAHADSGPLISGHSEADRFVMGMLRACADAVLVGAGTFRNAPGHRWSAEAIYPPAAALFTETRERLGLRPEPQLVLVTRSGDIDTTQPGARDAWIVTSSAGEAALRARPPSPARIIVLDSDEMRLADLLPELHAEGLQLLLTEGGPSLFAQLVAEHLVDELFVTSSPALFGRYPNDGRKSLAHGLDLAGAPLELWSARRHGSHLFLRYALASSMIVA
jgi:riboflavin biosynthesis pyrimidine reductase